MDFFDKYLYLFDFWSKDLLFPFEDDFFTNPKERSVFHLLEKKVKFIEFVQSDGTLISFQFSLYKNQQGKLETHFALMTFIKGIGFSEGYNELYLYGQKEQLKKLSLHLEEKIKEIKRILHEKEGEKLRFAVGVDVFDPYPTFFKEQTSAVLNMDEKAYQALLKAREME